MIGSTLLTKGVLVIGQAKTGRLEVISEYLIARCPYVAVIALDSALSQSVQASCALYAKGLMTDKFELPLRRLRLTLAKQRNLPVLYLIQLLSVLLCLRRIRRRFHLCLGTGPFPAILGLLLRRMGIAFASVYYCLDYFPKSSRASLTVRLLHTVTAILDNLATISSSITWNLSPRILEVKERNAKLPRNRYRHLVVPLGFSSRLLRMKPVSEIDRWSIVFVGTSGPYHGMGLLVESVALAAKSFPKLNVHIIGPGADRETKTMIERLGLASRFRFDGFIDSEDELFERVSRFALGVAPYTDVDDNPTIYTDPGKPKLYAFCGLPVIITRVPQVAEVIAKVGAGIAVPYDVKSMSDAIEFILEDDARLERFKKRALEFAMTSTAEMIFDAAFLDTVALLNPDGN